MNLCPFIWTEIMQTTMICCYYSNRKRLRISTITTFVRLLLLFKCWPPLSDCRTLIITAAQSLCKICSLIYGHPVLSGLHTNVHEEKFPHQFSCTKISLREKFRNHFLLLWTAYPLANWVLLLAVFTANTTWYFTILLWLENFHQSIFSFPEYSKRIIWIFSFAFVEYGL